MQRVGDLGRRGGKVTAHRPDPKHKGQPGEFLPGLPQVQFEGHRSRGGKAQGLVADSHDRGSIPEGHARQLTLLVTGGHLKEFGHQDLDQRRAAGRGGADPDGRPSSRENGTRLNRSTLPTAPVALMDRSGRSK